MKIFAAMYLLPALRKQRVSTLLLLASVLLISEIIYAQSPAITLTDGFKPLKYENYCTAYEDSTRSTTPSFMISRPDLFQDMDSLQYRSPLSYYWMKATLHNPHAHEQHLAIAFRSLTFVDLFIYHDTALLQHKRAGAFRKKIEITPSDKRTSFSFVIPPNSTRTLLLKTEHTKYYTPQLQFLLQQKEAYVEAADRERRHHYWQQGALFIFIIYTMLSWIVSRFRPYLWLLVFILGIGLYNLSINNYVADWFFPNHPGAAWYFVIHFIHLAILGIYLLMMDFWQLRTRSPKLYRTGKLFIASLFLIIVVSFCINFFTSNFRFTSNLNLYCYIFPFSFISYTSWSCWGRLNAAQRFLAYGLILFLAAGLAITLTAALFAEAAFSILPFMTTLAVVGVFVLFSIGLKEEQRQHEKDKHEVLRKLHELQTQQNRLLEKMVAERTADLQSSNAALDQQRSMLAERNQRIETLMNELAHRVKNNLQVLYGLIKLQLPLVQDPAGQSILKSNISRIKAMMLVNEKLSHFETMTDIDLREFTRELVLHSTSIYSNMKNVSIDIDIPTHLRLDGRQALPFGFIIAELLANSFKHAFPAQSAPAITIRVAPADQNRLHCIYADNGKGMDETSFQDNSTSMGLSLVKDMTRQLKGSVTVQNENGLQYTFIIPMQ